MADERRKGSAPHPRATALFARTVYRELRRASYSDNDLVRFVGDLMEIMSKNLGERRVGLELGRHLAAVLDPETGLPNRQTFEEILDFEIRRADEAGGLSLLLVCVEVHIPSRCPDDVAQQVHERTAAALQRRLRNDDVVSRLPPDRYLVLLPNAATDLVLTLCARFGAELHGGRPGDPELPPETRFDVRWVVRDEPLSAAAMLDRCLAAPAIPLGVVEEERAVTSLGTRELGRVTKRAERPQRKVVLALGGGAVRAGAHVGVVEALEEAGVEVTGIAGTSAGALVGAMLVSGQSGDQIVERFEAFTQAPLYRELRQLYAAYMARAKRSPHAAAFRQSGLSFMSDREMSAASDEMFSRFIEFFLGPDRDMSTLARPFATSATDLVEGRPAIFIRGPLHHAVRCSCAAPGLFSPQKDGARLLVDGSTVSEVPIAAALGLRLPAPVVAVYLETTTRKVERFSTSAEVLTRTSALVQSALVREQLRSAPIVLDVPVRDGGWLDFRRARETREAGAVVTRMSLERLLDEIDRAAPGPTPGA